MKKLILLATAIWAIATISTAQSRVFKEISEDIRSEFRAILQDQSLVGYTMLTQLEKTSEDSFNYKLTIMDENLNDIGVVSLKDESISMKGVAFENDLLSLVFVKNKVLNRSFRNQKQAKASMREAGTTKVVVKFMDLSGKIVNEHQYTVNPDIEPGYDFNAARSERIVTPVKFKQDPIIRNIPGKGFMLFYRDNDGSNNNLTVYDNEGREKWTKFLAKEEKCYLLTSAENISMLCKKLKNDSHYTLRVMGLDRDSPVQEVLLQDQKGNTLNVLDFGNDPVSHRPYVAGMILRDKDAERYETYNGYMNKGVFRGVYAISITGSGKKDVKKTFSYWKSSDMSGDMTSSGRFARNKSLPVFNTAARDHNGNFYFSGVSIVRKPKWGNIAGAVITSLSIVIPIFFLMAGTRKIRTDDAVVLKQGVDGSISVNDQIELHNSRFTIGRAPFGFRLSEYFSNGYGLKGNDAKTNYLILDNPKEITVYNITQKKIDRTIAHKADGILTQVAPAKDGHIMVYEYNKKEKSTRLSIEAL